MIRQEQADKGSVILLAAPRIATERLVEGLSDQTGDATAIWGALRGLLRLVLASVLPTLLPPISRGSVLLLRYHP